MFQRRYERYEDKEKSFKNFLEKLLSYCAFVAPRVLKYTYRKAKA